MDGFGNQTFSDLFWKAFRASGGDIAMLDYARGWHTFCFELCTPDNQVVVRYFDYKVYLLAARENETGVHLDVSSWAKQMNVPCAPSFRFGNTLEMLDFVSSREPSRFEGIVVCDKDYNRVKVKNAGYLALNKIKDSVAKSPRSALEIILLGKEDDVLPLVSEPVGIYIAETKDKLQKLLHLLDEEYARCYSADRKTFALAIQAGSGYISPAMARWGGKCSSAHDWIMSNRKNGTWSDSYLDTLLYMTKNISRL